MFFHLDEKVFKKFIDDMSKKVKVDADFENGRKQLHRAGEIQIEATSFTVSEPTELHTVEPILYKYANEREKELLTKEYDIEPFEIKVQKLERI